MEEINGHAIGRTAKSRGKWTATCGTCAARLTTVPVTANTLQKKIEEHTATVPAEVFADTEVPDPALSTPEVSEVVPDSETPAVSEGTRQDGSRRKNARVPQSGIENFEHLAKYAPSQRARAFWARYLKERIEVKS